MLTLEKIAGEKIVDPRATQIVTRQQGDNLITAMGAESPELEKYFLVDDQGRELVAKLPLAAGHLKAYVLVLGNTSGAPFDNFQEAMTAQSQAISTWDFFEKLAEKE